MEPVTVVVRDLPERHVIYVRHVGPYQGMAEVFATMFETLARWASARGLTGPDTLALATYHDNPDITDDDKLRVSACFTVPPGTVGSGEVGAMVLPGGPCAVGHFELDATQYGAAWEAMVCRWLPGSGYEPDDRLCYELYPSPGCDGKGAEPVQIHFPVRPLS
jgi:AraC family transcriptional regulator